MSVGEPGPSEGARSRMEGVMGLNEAARENRCGKGLRAMDGMECVGVGEYAVGGSYLSTTT